MADRHDLLGLDILRPGGMQDQVLSIARHLKVTVGFLGDVAKFSKQGVNVAPLKIMRDGMLKDSVVGALDASR